MVCVHVYVYINLVSRGYPAKYSNYVNDFKHLSPLITFPFFLEWS